MVCIRALSLSFLFAREVHASFVASGGTCPIDTNDSVSCDNDTCTCMERRKLESIIEKDSTSTAISLRGANDGRALQYGKTDGKGWGWVDCWAHYGCGWQKDVDLKAIGLEDEIRDRWENGGGAAGDGIVDDLERLICEDGKKSGRCSGGTEKAGECKDPALIMPRWKVGSPSFWIGGFGLDWSAKKTGHCAKCCVDIYTVTLVFKDTFDCDPWLYTLDPVKRTARLIGMAGPYDVTYKWEITIECPVTCAPTSSPTPESTSESTTASSEESTTKITSVSTTISSEESTTKSTSVSTTVSSEESTLGYDSYPFN